MYRLVWEIFTYNANTNADYIKIHVEMCFIDKR